MKISHLLIICVLQCTFLAFGQNSSLNQNAIKQELNFHLLDISSGLSHNYINDIQEDSLGFIWIATYDGLNRYDGQSFKHFKNQFKRDDLNAGEEIGTYEGLNRYGIKNNKVQKPQIGESYNGISNNYIQDIEISSDSLLIATDAGLNFLNLRKSQITSFDVENGLYSNKVSKIINGPENYVVIGTYGGGIQFLDARGNLNNLQEFLKTPDRLSSNDISSILIQGEETMWVGTFNNGLNKINLLNGSITTFHPESESPLVSSVVNSLYEDQFHNLWIGTRNGLQVISKSGDNLNFEFSNGISRQIQEEDILSFQEDGLGNLWIGTRNGGLYIVRFDMPLKKGQNIDVKHFPPRSDGLSVFNRTVSVIFRDSHGNMWLGTPTGLNFVNPNGEKIRLLKKILMTNIP